MVVKYPFTLLSFLNLLKSDISSKITPKLITNTTGTILAKGELVYMESMVCNIPLKIKKMWMTFLH